MIAWIHEASQGNQMNMDTILGQWEQTWAHGPTVTRKKYFDEDGEEIYWEINASAIDKEVERQINLWIQRKEPVFEEE